jgi:hypothetical protein
MDGSPVIVGLALSLFTSTTVTSALIIKVVILSGGVVCKTWLSVLPEEKLITDANKMAKRKRLFFFMIDKV